MNIGFFLSLFATSLLVVACGGNGSDRTPNTSQGSNGSSGGAASAPSSNGGSGSTGGSQIGGGAIASGRPLATLLEAAKPVNLRIIQLPLDEQVFDVN